MNLVKYVIISCLSQRWNKLLANYNQNIFRIDLRHFGIKKSIWHRLFFLELTPIVCSFVLTKTIKLIQWLDEQYRNEGCNKGDYKSVNSLDKEEKQWTKTLSATISRSPFGKTSKNEIWRSHGPNPFVLLFHSMDTYLKQKSFENSSWKYGQKGMDCS